MCSCIGHVAEIGASVPLGPLRTALFDQIPLTQYLQADETPVKILKPDKKGYMWAYHSLDPERRFIVFWRDEKSSTYY